MKKVTVKQNPEAEIPTEIIAQSIVDISAGMKKIQAGRLNERALILLLQAAIGERRISQSQISDVLRELAYLSTRYVRKVN